MKLGGILKLPSSVPRRCRKKTGLKGFKTLDTDNTFLFLAKAKDNIQTFKAWRIKRGQLYCRG